MTEGFPHPCMADDHGLLAVGGDLTADRLLLAYCQGIFPWPNSGHLLWFSPDPRCVLFPDKVHVTRSMKRILRSGKFTFRFDSSFRHVIQSCSTIPRDGQPGTWITPAMVEAYCGLHELGYAHSLEAWQDGKLAGGLYGISLGGAFFGESMFSRVSNASKACFITLACQAEQWGFDFIDCQLPNDHLIRLGAQVMARAEFLDRLTETLKQETRKGTWNREEASTSSCPSKPDG